MNRYLSLLLLTLCMGACIDRSNPVVSDRTMEDILYDLYRAEAVAILNPETMLDDEVRRELLSIILQRHGVEVADYDSALSWYRMHSPDYMKVYTQLEKRLNEETEYYERLANLDAKTRLSPKGDSVDIWSGTRLVRINPYSKSEQLIRSIYTDVHFGDQDRFRLSFTLPVWESSTKQSLTVRWKVVLKDGSEEVRSDQIGSNGIYEWEINAKQPINKMELYSYYTASPDGLFRFVWLSDLSLVRVHRTQEEVEKLQAAENPLPTDTLSVDSLRPPTPDPATKTNP